MATSYTFRSKRLQTANVSFLTDVIVLAHPQGLREFQQLIKTKIINQQMLHNIY